MFQLRMDNWSTETMYIKQQSILFSIYVFIENNSVFNLQNSRELYFLFAFKAFAHNHHLSILLQDSKPVSHVQLWIQSNKVNETITVLFNFKLLKASAVQKY